jgi:pimeloyl-ACP methyl ester carboxylesterase
MAVTQKAPLASTFGDAVSDPAWKHTPSWYQLSRHDRMIAPENQKNMAARIQPKRLLELDASHASLASKPTEVTALILEACAAVAG